MSNVSVCVYLVHTYGLFSLDFVGLPAEQRIWFVSPITHITNIVVTLHPVLIPSTQPSQCYNILYCPACMGCLPATAVLSVVSTQHRGLLLIDLILWRDKKPGERVLTIEISVLSYSLKSVPVLRLCVDYVFQYWEFPFQPPCLLAYQYWSIIHKGKAVFHLMCKVSQMWAEKWKVISDLISWPCFRYLDKS